MSNLVTASWLAERLNQPGIIILDASAHLPDAGRDAATEFAAGHIPGARYLGLDTFKDDTNPVPAAIPTAGQFAARMSALGIKDGDRVIIYDDSAVKTSARAWFILRMYGLNVAILDGGLGKWRDEGRPLESALTPHDAGNVTPTGGAGAVRSKAEVLANISSRVEQLLDARGAGRFSGAEPEFRPGMPSGHIPGSRNLPFGVVFNADGTFKDASGLRTAFEDAGVALDQPVVTTCGSGVTAAVLLFALHLLGKNDTALYDGSWSEWAADPTTPKATGKEA